MLFSRLSLSVLFMVHLALNAQTNYQCLSGDELNAWALEKANNSSRGIHDWLNTPPKLIRVNIHYMLKSDGTGNFTETGNAALGIESGYIFAKDHVAEMNKNAAINPKMNILPNNTTPNLNKQIQFVLDGVYFVRDDSKYFFCNGCSYLNYPSDGHNTDNVLNFFLEKHPSSNSVGGKAGGYLSPTSKDKYIEDFGYYDRYLAFVNSTPGTDHYEWALSNANSSHETGHLLCLSHTVRKNCACKCPTTSFPYPDPGCSSNCYVYTGNADPGCDDGCGDTPSAIEVTDVNNSGKHPACGWNTGGQMWCSNNLMDYNGSEALTPCQLDIIHSALEGGMKSYTVCDAVKNNLNLTIMGYPQIGYYGKNVAIKPLSIFGTTINPVLNGINRAEVYFNESVTMENFEIKDQAEFEVIYSNLCP